MLSFLGTYNDPTKKRGPPKGKYASLLRFTLARKMRH